jgi:putative tricarboxylic transport membrane protein
MQNKSDILAGLFLLLLGIAVTIRSIAYQLGTAHEPQPGLFPFLLGLFLIVLSTILILNAGRGHSTGMSAFGNLWRPAILVGGLVIYVLITNFAGYVISTTLLAIVTLRVMDTKKWWVVVGSSLLIAIGSYVLFDRLLDLPLPAGIIAGGR